MNTINEADLKKLEEIWMHQFPNVELPGAAQWQRWGATHSVETIAFGFRRTGQRFRFLRHQGQFMDQDYIQRFASKVMNIATFPAVQA
jgi:hypothetical protein